VRKYLLIAALSAFASLASGQNDLLPNDPAIFADSVNTILTNTRNNTAMEVADNFSLAWSALGLDQQQKVIEQSITMVENGHRIRPLVMYYLETIANAVNIEGADAQKITEYQNMTSEVIAVDDAKAMLSYFKTMSDFFAYRSLYYARSNKLVISEDEYSFEFVGPPPIEKTLPAQEPVEEDNWEEDNWEEDNWEEDDWEDDEWEDDENWADEEWEEEEEWSDESRDDAMIAAVTGGNTLPIVEGPVIHFEKADLNFVTPYDSVFLKKTSGDFLINSRQFVGKGGTFDWSMAGLSKDSVFVKFTDYSFKTNLPYLKAESASLTYKGKVADPVEGVFKYRSVRHDTTITSQYPQFESYYANIRIKDLGENLIYKGGFSLKGQKIYSSSILGGLSTIEVHDSATKRFKSQSRIFEFQDSSIVAERASAVIFQGNDSIYHPVVRLDYDYNNEYLILQKDKGGYKNTPFTSTFFNIDFTADLIRWDLNADSLDASIIGARRIVPAIIESSEHYSFEDYKSLGDKIYDFNPLSMAVYYANGQGSDQFYVVDLAKYYNKKQKIMDGAMVFLDQKGLIDYDRKNGLVTIKPKAQHLYDSKVGLTDYDEIGRASCRERV